jgi:hypothetical protein
MTLEKELQSQGSNFLTTKNKMPDTKSQQEKWQKENSKTGIIQMGLHSGE